MSYANPGPQRDLALIAVAVGLLVAGIVMLSVNALALAVLR